MTQATSLICVLSVCGVYVYACGCAPCQIEARLQPSYYARPVPRHELHFNKTSTFFCTMAQSIPLAVSLSIPACFQGSYPCSIYKMMYPAVKKCLCSCHHPGLLL